MDWLYPALAAVAAVEQAVLQPSSGLTYDAKFAAQVCMLQFVAQVLCLCLLRLRVQLLLCVSAFKMSGSCWGCAGVMLRSCWGHAGMMLRS